MSAIAERLASLGVRPTDVEAERVAQRYLSGADDRHRLAAAVGIDVIPVESCDLGEPTRDA